MKQISFGAGQPVPDRSLFKYDDSLVFELPGYGVAKADCGEPTYVCHVVDSSHVHYVTHKKTCHRKDCPVCYPTWQKRESMAISDRIESYYKSTGKMPVHYVVSPPQDTLYNSKSLFKALRRKAYEIGKLRGIRGGCMVFHERSERYSDSETYTKSHCSNGPHFHIIGDGWLSKTKELFLIDGWIVKNLKVRKLKYVYPTAFYILDHAAIGHTPDSGYPAISQSTTLRVKEIASVTWFGSMSYNKLKLPKFTGSTTIYCPICDDEIDKSDWFVMEWLNTKSIIPAFGVEEQGNNGVILVRPLSGWYGGY